MTQVLDGVTANELLAVMGARELEDNQTVFTGVGAPMLASVLAQRLHTPGLTMMVEGGIVGHLRASEIARDRVEDARTALKVGDTIEAKITGVDRKTRIISLSIKAKEAHEEQQALQNYKSESGRSTTGTTLGDLLKEQMNPNE